MVGWDAYRSYDMAAFRPGEVTRQFSSYDRGGLNDDGFEGTYSCLRNDTDGRCVIAEQDGPGEIASIWFTYLPDSVEPIGSIEIQLDGKTVLDGDLQSIVNSETAEPFVWPLVGNTNDTNGGNVIKVPMPYGKSMKVTTENNPHFYHVVYRVFPDGTEVATFDPNEKASDVLQTSRAYGARDPKVIGSNNGAGAVTQKVVKLDAGVSESVVLSEQCGTVSQLQIRVPEISQEVWAYDDGRAFGAGGGSQMTLQLDPANSKCSLTRRVDLSVGNQVISVAIDGDTVGQLSTGDAQNSTWSDQVIELTPSVTKGKSSITVSTKFVSSDLDANEFFYALHCTTDEESWSTSAYGPSTDWTLMDLVNVGPNNPHNEKAHSYKITQQTWEGLREYIYVGERQDEAVSSNQLLNSLLLSMSFDGQETVSNVPLGSFFGGAIKKNTIQTLLLTVDGFIANGAFSSYFPMPFSKEASLTILNNSTLSANATINWRVMPCASSCSSSSPSSGHFSLQHSRGMTTPGVDWPIFSATGPGVFYGLTHTIRGSILPPANDLEFLEGDLQVYINRTSPPENLINDTSAVMLGTGTEDFYESGWYWADNNTALGPDGTMSIVVPYGMPLVGLAGHVRGEPDLGCVGQCLDIHRFMISDSMAFGEQGISVNIEHGSSNIPNTVQAEYETCAFYYA